MRALLLALTLTGCAHAPGALQAARCLVADPGLGEVLAPEYAAEVQAALDRLNNGTATDEDIPLLADAVALGVRLAQCVPKPPNRSP